MTLNGGKWTNAHIDPRKYLTHDDRLIDTLSDLIGGYEFAVFSDNTFDQVRPAIKAMRLASYFPTNRVQCCGLLMSPYRKPNPTVFKNALSYLDWTYRNVIAVGMDRELHIDPILQLNGRGVLVRSLEDVYRLPEVLAIMQSHPEIKVWEFDDQTDARIADYQSESEQDKDQEDRTGDDALVWQDWEWKKNQTLLAIGTLSGLNRTVGKTKVKRTLPSGLTETITTQIDIDDLNRKLAVVKRRLLKEHAFLSLLPLDEISIRVRWPMYKSAYYEIIKEHISINIDLRTFKNIELLYIALEHELTHILLDRLMTGINPALREIFILLAVNVQRFIQLRDSNIEEARRLLVELGEEADKSRGMLPVYSKIMRSKKNEWAYFIDDIFEMVVDLDHEVYWQSSWHGVVRDLYAELGFNISSLKLTAGAKSRIDSAHRKNCCDLTRVD